MRMSVEVYGVNEDLAGDAKDLDGCWMMASGRSSSSNHSP